MGFDLNGRITIDEETLVDLFSNFVKEKYDINLNEWNTSFSFPSRRELDKKTNMPVKKYLLISLEKIE